MGVPARAGADLGDGASISDCRSDQGGDSRVRASCLVVGQSEALIEFGAYDVQPRFDGRIPSTAWTAMVVMRSRLPSAVHMPGNYPRLASAETAYFGRG
jgi:hypothetical protein